MKNVFRTALLSLLAGSGAIGSANAAIVISEVDSAASGNSTYAFDWFELTNTGASAVNITGWKMDDDSNSFAAGVVLTGVSSIAAGQSVVFANSTTSSALTSFVTNWFGGTAPAGFTLGTYVGSGTGLSTTADAVNIFDSLGALQANVLFGAATSGKSFDNAAGLNNATITQLSAVGVNGAFAGADGRIGSPGSVAPVPVPAAIWLLGSGLGLLGAARRRRRAG
jgi:hypothetical protein